MGNSLNIIQHYIHGICVAHNAVDIHTVIPMMRSTKIKKLHNK